MSVVSICCCSEAVLQATSLAGPSVTATVYMLLSATAALCRPRRTRRLIALERSAALVAMQSSC